jgi:hypothetical protein
MRTRSTIIAAFCLAAATILAVAACGTSVSGSAQPNPAAETVSIPSSSDISLPSELTADTAVPTDLSALTSMLGNLPTGGEIPTDLGGLNSLLQDLPSGALPSDLGDLTNLNIPGPAAGCLPVVGAYSSVSLALLPVLFGGSDAFNSADLEKALSSLNTGDVPAELVPDIQALGEVAAEANGKSLTEVSDLLNSEKYTTADKHISDWLDANCNGG